MFLNSHYKGSEGKQQRRTQKITKNVEKMQKIQKDAEKCRKMWENAEIFFSPKAVSPLQKIENF